MIVNRNHTTNKYRTRQQLIASNSNSDQLVVVLLDCGGLEKKRGWSKIVQRVRHNHMHLVVWRDAVFHSTWKCNNTNECYFIFRAPRTKVCRYTMQVGWQTSPYLNSWIREQWIAEKNNRPSTIVTLYLEWHGARSNTAAKAEFIAPWLTISILRTRWSWWWWCAGLKSEIYHFLKFRNTNELCSC